MYTQCVQTSGQMVNELLSAARAIKFAHSHHQMAVLSMCQTFFARDWVKPSENSFNTQVGTEYRLSLFCWFCLSFRHGYVVPIGLLVI